MESAPAAPRALRYTTLAPGQDATAGLEIKRSRFVGYLRRTDEEEQARAFVAELRRTHHEARHHCSAFILGPDREVRRSSDDGEPAGTAGVPMLEALAARQTDGEHADLSDVCVVVVRYFGGVKLGAGGLVRAYSEAVSITLDRAKLVRRERMRLWRVAVEHAEVGRLESALRTERFAVLGSEYGAKEAYLQLAVPDLEADLTEAAERLAALTGGRAAAEDAGWTWLDRPLER